MPKETNHNHTVGIFTTPHSPDQTESRPVLQSTNLLLENLHEVIYRIRLVPDPAFEYISPAIASLTGYTPTEYYRNPVLLLLIVHPADQDSMQRFLAGQLKQSEPLVLRVFHKNGNLVWLEFMGVIITGLQGQPIALEGIVRDISETQQTRGALGESQALLASIIETAQDAMIVLNSDQKITLFNPAAEEMFGYQVAEVIGQPLDRFLPGQITSWHAVQVEEFGRKNLTRHRMGVMHQVSGVRSNGKEFPIEVSLSSFEIAGEKFFTAIVRDITERKRVEEELRYLSTHDALTSLYNRHYFQEELSRLEQARSYPVSIVIADVDGLKNVNDQEGHRKGDELIVAVAEALRAAFRKEDVVARLGGDEFGVILPFSDADTTEKAIQRIYSCLLEINLSGSSVETGLSIGAATALSNEKLTETVKRADMNMYQHKFGKYHRRREWQTRGKKS